MNDEYCRLLGKGDPGQAEAEYRHLFEFFCRFFEWRGCEDPEDLTQTVFERGLRRIRQGEVLAESGLAGYLFGIAKFVLKENRRARRAVPLPFEQGADLGPHHLGGIETKVLIGQCLDRLPPEERDLLLSYVNGERTLPGHSPQGLRLRVHRIRRKLLERIGEVRERENKP